MHWHPKTVIQTVLCSHFLSLFGRVWMMKCSMLSLVKLITARSIP